ncbi:MAG: hypothetical protein LBI53_07640 [Candidatus Peribacteria bacterium]|jgi:hypothetical protein|nr:hypothetical protein [Candidatus Peribacteria bacterium]
MDFIALELLLLYFGFLFKFLKQDYLLSDVTKRVIYCIECKIDQVFENKRQEMVSKLQNRNIGEKKKKECVIISPKKEIPQIKPVENKIDPMIDEVLVSISSENPVFLSRLRRSYIKHTGIHHSLLENHPKKEKVMSVLREKSIAMVYPEEKVVKTTEENLPLTIDVPSFAKEQKKDDVLLQRFDTLLNF